MEFVAEAKDVLFSKRNICFQRIAKVDTASLHGHILHSRLNSRNGQLVFAGIHLVIGLLPVCLGIEFTPAEAVLVGDIDKRSVIVDHVHPLVDKSLARDRLMACLEGQQVIVTLEG